MSKKKSFKMPKPGEGTRVRRKSNYGEGGRATGGAARNHQMKASVSKKGAVSSAKKKPKFEFPDPGGHPADLTEKAKEQGHDVAGGRDNAFSRLHALTQRTKSQKDNTQTKLASDQAKKGTEPLDKVPDGLLDELFESRHEKLRPTHTPAERAQNLEAQRHRLPILRDGTGTPDTATTTATTGDSTAGDSDSAHTADVEGSEQAAAQGDETAPTTALVGGQERSLTAEQAHAQAGMTAYTTDQQQELAGIMGMPGVVCNRCPAADGCPKFEEGASCAYNEYFSGLSSRNVNNLIPVVESFADMQATRARRAVFLEQRVTGGQIDPNVTRQIQIATDAAIQAAKLKGAFATANKQSITVMAQGAKPQGGILSRLMAGITGAAPQQPGEIPLRDDEQIIEAEAKVTIKAETETVTTDVLKTPEVSDD